MLPEVSTQSNTSLRDHQLTEVEAGPILKYKENQILPDSDAVARRLILELIGFEVKNGILFHSYYQRSKEHMRKVSEAAYGSSEVKG